MDMTEIVCNERDAKLLGGCGTLKYANGDIYNGEFCNDNFHGRGEMRYGNGAVYNGDWVDSCFCGNGTFTLPQGEV
jgi:hypothetical protein